MAGGGVIDFMGGNHGRGEHCVWNVQCAGSDVATLTFTAFALGYADSVRVDSTGVSSQAICRCF